MARLCPLLFCTLVVPVNLHNRCIDHDIFRVRITRQSIENPFEDIGIALEHNLINLAHTLQR